jgi:hypothetical protein
MCLGELEIEVIGDFGELDFLFPRGLGCVHPRTN